MQMQIDFPRDIAYNSYDSVIIRFLRREMSMGYLSIKQTSEKWNISPRWINDLCINGRIPGATKIGSFWAIPNDAEKPVDQRIKSGRYCKTTIANES